MSEAAETAAKHIDIGFVRIGPTDVKSLIVFVIISLVFLCVFSALMTPDEEEQQQEAPKSPKPTRGKGKSPASTPKVTPKKSSSKKDDSSPPVSATPTRRSARKPAKREFLSPTL